MPRPARGEAVGELNGDGGQHAPLSTLAACPGGRPGQPGENQAKAMPGVKSMIPPENRVRSRISLGAHRALQGKLPDASSGEALASPAAAQAGLRVQNVMQRGRR
jgi:hypothetical protein